MNVPTIRHDRVQQPSVTVPLRDAAGQIELVDLWREDRLDPDPDGPAVYLVLDFADEMRLIPTGNPSDVQYRPTGGLLIRLQAVDRDTGAGLAMPVERSVDPIVPDGSPAEVVTPTGGRVYSTRPLTGLTHLPVSPRRRAAADAEGN